MTKSRFYFFSNRYALRYHLSKRLLERGWVQASDASEAIFNDNHLILNDDISMHLEQKHLLARLVNKHCPDIMPMTYAINDQNYDEVLAKIRYEHYLFSGSNQEKLQWILKPALLNNGDNIKLFNTLEEVKQHYATQNRLGGDHVLQRYIGNPDLIDERKYTFRMPVIITNYAGAFVYHQGYINISAKKYNSNDAFLHRNMHITNYVLDGELSHIEQRSTQTLSDFEKTFDKMRKTINVCLRAIINEFPLYLKPKDKRFELFGFDFMLDSDKRLWLLEINQGPDAPMYEENPMKAILWEPFWEDIINDFVIPIAKDKIPSHSTPHWVNVVKPSESYSRLQNLLSNILSRL